MLDLINAERVKVEAFPVVLGDNNAAQAYAKASLADCIASHWSLDGLIPQVRYSLGGGYQLIRENRWLNDFCVAGADDIASVEEEIRKAMNAWMADSGARSAIQGRHAKKVNIGLAWEGANLVAVQQFEEDHIQYEQLPAIANGVLSMSGRVNNRFDPTDLQELEVRIYYASPPDPIGIEQAIKSRNCRTLGTQVALISARAPDAAQVPDYVCKPFRPGDAIVVSSLTAITPQQDIMGRAFDLQAGLGALIDEYGAGVYTVQVYIRGRIISQYSIFHGIAPPDTYE